MHLSDTHLDPRPAGQGYTGEGRSVGVLEWFARRAAEAAEPGGAGPEFAIHTGDVFEYSIVDDCWRDWDRAVEGAGLPIHLVPGNHDNTWGSINARLRERHGGDSHALEHRGWRFICLNSAGSLDPLPCWDQRTLTWLRDQLREVDAATPIVLAMHHPLAGGDAGYASEYDPLRFWDVVRGHNVLLVLDGHWHQVHCGLWQNTPRINGGETFRLNPGYATVAVRDGVLTHRYHFHESAEGGARDTLVLRRPTDTPDPRLWADLRARHEPGAGSIELTGEISSNRPKLLGGELAATAWLNGDRDARRQATIAADPSEPAQRRLRVSLPAGGLPPGRHFATVRIERPGESVAVESEVGRGPQPLANEQAIEFETAADGQPAATRFACGAGVKTALLAVEPRDGSRLVVFGDTAGRVTALDAGTLAQRWRHESLGEILHALAPCGERLAVGDSDGNLRLLDAATGSPLWTVNVGAALYGAPLAVEGALYVGDCNGRLLAVDAATGDTLWAHDAAEYAIESSVAHDAARDRLVVGAWDGKLYAVDRQTGAPAWQAWSPSCEVATRSRYYGPADCPPLVIGDEVWATDRGYRLGRYEAASGAFLGVVREAVSGVSLLEHEGVPAGVLARGLGGGVARLDLSGRPVWEADARAGRSPRPPVDAPGAGAVGVVSDVGLLTVVDRETGAVLLRHSLTPRLFVHSGLTYCPAEASWYAAGMDGVVSRVPMPPRPDA